MLFETPSFTVGIEEEYLLVDKNNYNLIKTMPKEFIRNCRHVLKDKVSPEFLQCQIEIGTKICGNLTELKSELIDLRQTIADNASKINIAPIAAATHPFAAWEEQKHTDRNRYNHLAEDLQFVAKRLVICGMHIHVAIEDKSLRIDIFDQLTYFLPHLLALSTSSPFWQGQNTGLKSHRLTVFDGLPRTGLPPAFSSWEEYQRTVNILVKAGSIEDASKIWWDLRPSSKYPTLELRICDVCTKIDDAITIAALFMCTARMLYRLRLENKRWRCYTRFLIRENRWRAQRYGSDAGMIDFGKGSIVPYSELLEELISLIKQDIEYFNCEQEINNARQIIKNGTSADHQIKVYQNEIKNGNSEEAALRKVVENLVTKTVET